jgi:putative endonuclease
MSKSTLRFGKSSENEAVRFLTSKGYTIVACNYKNYLGEIDIIAKEKQTLCFVEVKSRSSGAYGLPKEAVDGRKQRKISQVAVTYLKERQLLNQACRFDVLAVLKDTHNQSQFELIKDAFSIDGDYTY